MQSRQIRLHEHTVSRDLSPNTNGCSFSTGQQSTCSGLISGNQMCQALCCYLAIMPWAACYCPHVYCHCLCMTMKAGMQVPCWLAVSSHIDSHGCNSAPAACWKHQSAHVGCCPPDWQKPTLLCVHRSTWYIRHPNSLKVKLSGRKKNTVIVVMGVAEPIICISDLA